MYEMNQRDTKRTKRRLEKSKETEESKKMKKDEKLLNTYMREERKLFLGGRFPLVHRDGHFRVLRIILKFSKLEMKKSF